MFQRFDDRVVLVTGAATGLGRAYAKWFAERGAQVIANNRVHPGRPEGAADVVRGIVECGGRATADAHDAAKAGAGTAMVEAAIATFGRIDALVLNAAANTRRPAQDLSMDDLRAGMTVNFWGSIEPAMAALPHMLARDYGRIIFTTSAAALFGQRGHAAYAAAKMGITGFARALAIDLAKSNIRINTLSPYAWTDLARHVLPPAMERVMAPDHVADVVGWLASEACDVTGQIVAAGAGRMCRNAIVEGPAVAIVDGDAAAAWPAVQPLATIREPRNSGHSALDLIPELVAQNGV